MARKAEGQQGSETSTDRPARRKTATRKKADVPAATEGRLAVRRDISEYRAAAEAQADRVRERINAALEMSRRTREEIEERIASELHAPRVPAKKATKKAAPARKRTRAATHAPAK